MVKKFLLLLLIFVMVLLLYYPVLDVYFSHDDFFLLNVSQTNGSLQEFLNFFDFPPLEWRGYAFWRPIFREVLYNFFYSTFGLNHQPFRILQFLIHFINIGLVYLFLQKLLGKLEVSIFAAFFFGIGAANVATLYYLNGGIQALGITMFLLLTLLFFWHWLKSGKFKFKITAFLTFLLALGSHELAVVIPFLLGGLIFVNVSSFKKAIPKIFKDLWPFLVVLAIYLYLDIHQIGLPKEELEYQTVFSLKRTLNSFAWYSSWALGLPEMLIDFVYPGFKLNPALLRYWGGYFSIILPVFFASVAISVVSFFYLLRQRDERFFKNKRFWFLIFWFIVGLLPIIFLPLHKSTYYLVPSLPAFWGAFGFLVFSTYWRLKKDKSILASGALFLLILLLVLLSITSVRLGNTTYWAAGRGRLAEKLINDVKTKYPTLPKGAAVFFLNDPHYPFVSEQWGRTSKQAWLALSGDDALQLVYKDQTLLTFYEDLGGVPKDFSKDRVYPLVAIISAK